MASHPLSFRVKFFQGLGAAPNTIKNWGFGTLVFFYYERVLELPASQCALALFIALCFDAVTDPLVGSLSDNWRSERFGRRHGLMYLSVLPFMLTFYLLFVPPAELGPTGLFCWLTLFAVLVRGFMTLFVVPWSALAAELSPDYDERTVVMAYRFLLGWIAGVSTGWLAFTFVFHPTQQWTNGLFNADGYPLFGFWGALAIGLSAFLSARFTQSEVSRLPPPPPEPQPFSLFNVWREARLALSNRSFRLIFLATLTASAIAGVQTTLDLYVNTYFWGLLPEQLRWFGPFMLIGAVFAFSVVRAVGIRFDKKDVIIAVSAFLILDGMALIGLRLIGLIEVRGQTWLLSVLIGNAVLRTALAVVSGIITASILADILDEQELKTAERQEGMFYAALSFCGKAISGFGLLFGGLALQWLAIPRTQDVEQVDPGTITQLGVLVGILLPIFYAIPLWLLSKYPITRARHAEIRAALDAMRRERG